MIRSKNVFRHGQIRYVVAAFLLKLRNNSWKPYVYIVFTTGRPLCHKVLPRALARGKKLT
jgi:hypothetical protein